MNKTLKNILISLAAGLLAFVAAFSGIIDNYDYFLTDLLYQRPVMPDNRIKIIAIDERSMEALGPYNTWRRDVYSRLLEVLYREEEYAPKCLAFDVVFQGGMDTASDLEFAEKVRAAGNVVTAANIVFKPAVETDAQGRKYLNRMNVDFVEYPYEALRNASHVGFANTTQDVRDESVRRFFPKVDIHGETMDSLAMTIAGSLGESGYNDLELSDEGSFFLRYSTAPGSYEAISLIDILEEKIPPQALKGSILLVGAYAPGMQDAYPVPTGRGTQMYGVEIHANTLQGIMQGRTMVRGNTLMTSAICGAAAFIFSLLSLNASILVSVLAGALITVAAGYGGISLAGRGTFIPLLTLPVSLILIMVFMVGYRYLMELGNRRKIVKAFKQYVAPQVVEQISKKGDYVLHLGGELRDIAVLFVDIRGFTPLSEALTPEQVVEILNKYLSLTTKSIFDNGGTLDKFVGDATMAVFNSPFDLDDYVFKAVCAAWDMAAGSEMIRKEAMERFGKQVGFGIGVNCGEAVVGNIGCDFRMDYTAIGDTVNTAARLEANAKAGQILISQAVYDVVKDRVEAEPIGEIPLKGKSVGVMVYSVSAVKR